MVSGPLKTCYALPLERGVHVAQLKITSTTGKLYSYWWTFEIPDLDPQRYATALTATQSAIQATMEQRRLFETQVHRRIAERRATATAQPTLAEVAVSGEEISRR